MKICLQLFTQWLITGMLLFTEQEHNIKKDIVSSIISAASRKKGKKKEPARQQYTSDESDLSEIFSERNIDHEIEMRQKVKTVGPQGAVPAKRSTLESQSSTDTGVSSWASPPPTTPTNSTKTSIRQSSSSSSSTRKGVSRTLENIFLYSSLAVA